MMCDAAGTKCTERHATKLLAINEWLTMFGEILEFIDFINATIS